MCNDRKADGRLVKILGGGGTTNSAAVFETGMFGDHSLDAVRAPGKNPLDAVGEFLDELIVQFRPSKGTALTAQRTHVFVGKAFGFRLGKRVLLNQKPLSLVSFPGTAPTDDNGGQPGMLP
jgi:hypothetical protein